MSTPVNPFTATLQIGHHSGSSDHFVRFEADGVMDRVTIGFPNEEVEGVPVELEVNFEAFLYAMKGFVAQLELFPRKQTDPVDHTTRRGFGLEPRR